MLDKNGDSLLSDLHPGEYLASKHLERDLAILKEYGLRFF